ncbi:MAG: hypothetical protein QXP36_09380 [Conexivisphaerales archaeon]
MNRLSLAIVLLGVALYVLLPTPDEILVHLAFGIFLSQVLNVPLIPNGMFLSLIIYRSIGVVCLLGALLIGKKPISQKLKETFKRTKTKKRGIQTLFSSDRTVNYPALEDGVFLPD